MYTGFTWPLLGGMAAARGGGGAAAGRGALLAVVGAAALPVGFALGREVQRRLAGTRWTAPDPGWRSGAPAVPGPRYPDPAIPVGPPSWRDRTREVHR
ncbi:hypothetical protein [Streptomyces sp. NPDC021096]|uniref:hypothetical protein n=1 Tax=Streptomyces sp. NPDC021096 TaxID=3154792 RepID=UPI0034016321